MDFFASDVFLTALATDYHRAKKFEFKFFEAQGRIVRLLEINGRKVISTGPFYDYVKFVTSEQVPQGSVKHIPRLVTTSMLLPEKDPAASVPVTKQDPAPLVEWNGFSRWEEYVALLKKRSKSLLPNQQRRLQRLIKEHGEPTFIFDNPDTRAWDLCIQWKVRQYEGGHETLEDPRALAMLRRLFDERHLVLSTLQVADDYVAIQAGFFWEGEYLALIPAYDPDFGKYAVGKELLLRMMEYSYRHGHKRFDFLQGAEAYKWDFATHVQILDSYGRPPLAQSVRLDVQRWMKDLLVAISPNLFYRLKRLVISARALLSRAWAHGSAGLWVP